jgi:hypothetical protein
MRKKRAKPLAIKLHFLRNFSGIPARPQLGVMSSVLCRAGVLFLPEQGVIRSV